MRKYIVTALTALFISGLTGAGFAASTSPTIVKPNQVHWVAGTGPLKGAQVAMLVGDPSKSGPYVFRLKLPANTKFMSHYHGDTEMVTVISGTFYAGIGDKFDASKLMALPAGTFVSVPAKVHHYAMTKTVTVIQLEGYGPFSMTAVEKGGSM